MTEICQYTITITKEYTFNMLQKDDKNMSNKIKELFNPGDFWLDENTEVYQNKILDVVSLNNCNIDLLKIENGDLVEADSKMIEAVRKEKLEKIKEEEFLKNQLKLKI